MELSVHTSTTASTGYKHSPTSAPLLMEMWGRELDACLRCSPPSAHTHAGEKAPQFTHTGLVVGPGSLPP